jgi:hypothetical protein
VPDAPGTESPAQGLGRRLRARVPEIEARLMARLLRLYELPAGTRTELVAGAQVVTRDTVAYSLRAFEEGDDWSEPMPPSFGLQARYAARIGMSLEELLRAYSNGNTTIAEFVVEEVQEHLDHETLALGVAVQSRVADALISGLSAEYASELERLDSSPTIRIVRRVEQLLADDSLVDAEIDYRLDAWHIGAVISGSGAERTARLLADQMGCSVLLVPRSAEVYWAWWGGVRRISFSQLELQAGNLSGSDFLAVGEAHHGPEGFRVSHREAQIAAAVMVRRSDRLTRCADVMLPGAFLQEPALADLYLTTYLGPLKEHKDWPVLRETLAAYFDTRNSLASAAAVLAVDRHTVRRRLRKIEEILENPLDDRRAELEVALRLDELMSASLARPAP